MYNVRKGWPSNAAIDEIFKPASTITDPMTLDGKVVKLNTSTKVVDVAASIAEGDVYGFCIGIERVKGLVTALLSDCVIECDSEHYDAGTYNVGADVYVNAGKFTATGSGKAVGRVLAYESTEGLLRIMFFSLN